MQSHKRRKTLLACNQCRDRKTRCSGDRPSAGPVKKDTCNVDMNRLRCEPHHSFLNQVSPTAHRLERPVRPETISSSYSGKADHSSRLCDAPTVNSFVPGPDVDIDLMESFWNNIHPIFPLLHRPTILQAYEHLCEPHRAGTCKNSEESNTF
ncbi:hypothetical protein IG631_21298 [Alternaria alternata]|nr:hypothetical protein IG631_21298 [Alternaria alternata]